MSGEKAGRLRGVSGDISLSESFSFSFSFSLFCALACPVPALLGLLWT